MTYQATSEPVALLAAAYTVNRQVVHASIARAETAPDPGWRDRAPTAGEVRAHAEAHTYATNGRDPAGLWVVDLLEETRLVALSVWLERGIVAISGRNAACHDNATRWYVTAYGRRWRPVTADVMPAPWLVDEGSAR